MKLVFFLFGEQQKKKEIMSTHTDTPGGDALVCNVASSPMVSRGAIHLPNGGGPKNKIGCFWLVGHLTTTFEFSDLRISRYPIAPLFELVRPFVVWRKEERNEKLSYSTGQELHCQWFTIAQQFSGNWCKRMLKKRTLAESGLCRTGPWGKACVCSDLKALPLCPTNVFTLWH